jgi:hypothetical protein
LALALKLNNNKSGVTNIMKFFEYLVEAKKEYAEGVWAEFPTTKTLELKDLIKSGKIKEYTTTKTNVNPWLISNVAKADMLKDVVTKNFPSIVVAPSKPIILLIITLLKKAKSVDKIAEKVISVIEAGEAKYPKGEKSDVSDAFEIEKGAFTKGIIARTNEVVLYAITKEGGKNLFQKGDNNVFRLLVDLVEYVKIIKIG